MRFGFLFSSILIGLSTALSPQDTIYDYNNRTVYIHLNQNSNTESEQINQLFRIPFNAKFNSGDTISNYTITPPPTNDCSLVVTSTDLLSFCPNGKNLLAIARYDNDKDAWQNIPTKSGIMYYNDSTYIHTESDKTGIYIFSGASEFRGVTSLSNRMMRLDTQTWQASDASSRIQPQPFYKSTSVQINSNTQALFGGISGNNMLVPMMEIPLWQYNSWTERPCITIDNVPIASRIDALILPVFFNTNNYLLNETITTFEVSSILMLGGTDLNGTTVKPSVASLDISTYKWKWTDLTKNQTFKDQHSWDDLYSSVTSNIAAVSIYDTLLMINTDNNNNQKRDQKSQNYVITLYNATDFRQLDSVDYSCLNNLSLTKAQNYHFNKNLTIALSVVIPVLFIILLCVFLTYMYKKYKAKKEEERYGREVKEIVDFYENQHKRNSAYTFSSYDSDYKSTGEDDEFFDDVKINDFEDGDNLSLNSWRRKKMDFQHNISILSKVKPNFSKKNNSSSLKRSLSNVSNIIHQSLSRKNSVHSSINAFTNGSLGRNLKLDPTCNNNSTNENPFYSGESFKKPNVNQTTSPLPTPPPPAVPKHTAMFTLPDRTDSLLYHIPENTSLTTFHSQNLGYLPLKPSPTRSSPQHNYMKKLASIERHLSIDSSFDSSIYSASSNFYSSSPSRSPSRSPKRLSISSPSRSPSRLAKRPLSIMSTSSLYSANDAIPHLPPHKFGDFEEADEDLSSIQEVGSIKGDDANNIEVQVLVGSKRRTKLRVVNPDTPELPVLAEQDEEDVSMITERCVSSSSEKSKESEIRKRVVSDEYKDESFAE